MTGFDCSNRGGSLTALRTDRRCGFDPNEEEHAASSLALPAPRCGDGARLSGSLTVQLAMVGKTVIGCAADDDVIQHRNPQQVAAGHQAVG